MAKKTKKKLVIINKDVSRLERHMNYLNDRVNQLNKTVYWDGNVGQAISITMDESGLIRVTAVFEPKE